MEDADCCRVASDFPIDVRVVGIFADRLASGLFQVGLLAGNPDFDHHSQLFHGGYNIQLTESFYRSVMGFSSTVRLCFPRLYRF